MIFAAAGGVFGKAGTGHPVQTVLDDPPSADAISPSAVRGNGEQHEKAEDLGCWPIVRDSQASGLDSNGEAEIGDGNNHGAASFDTAAGPNRFALDGIRFSRGNGRRSGSFTRVGLIVLEGEDMTSAGSNSAVKQQKNGSLEQIFHIDSAKHDLSTAGQVSFVCPAPDKMPVVSIPAALISTTHRLAIRGDALFRVASEPPGKTGMSPDVPSWQLGSEAEAPVSEPVLQSSRQARHASGRRRTRSRVRLKARLLVSFLLGAAAAAVAPMAFNKIAALHADYLRHGTNFTDIRWMKDPLALPRMYRDNRLFSYLDFAVNRSTKQPHIGLELAAAGPDTEGETADDGASIAPGANLEDQAPVAGLDEEAESGGPETPALDGIRTLPSLFFDRSARRQVIGNFETRSLPGDYGSCTEIAQSMIRDAKAGQNSLHTLADTEAIKVMRICAANGTVIITCRNDQVTISPRRPRPNDGCNAHRVSNPDVKTL